MSVSAKEHQAINGYNMTGKTQTAETKNKISEALSGKSRKPFTDETKSKMSEANRRRGPRSAATKLKISEGVKRRNAAKI